MEPHVNRRSFLAAAALGPFAAAGPFSASAHACPNDSVALLQRLRARRVPLDLTAGATPEAIEALAQTLRISEQWISVSSMNRVSSKLRRAAERDAEAASQALSSLVDFLARMPEARLRDALERLRAEPELEQAWRVALRGACPPALARRLDTRVDETLTALLSGPPLPQVRAWTAGVRGPALAKPMAKRAPPGQRVVVGVGLGAFGGLVLSRGALMLLAGGPALWPILFTGMGALLLAAGVGVLVVAIRDLRAAG